jgi:deoxyribodipyrimidine photolyase-related protein
MNKTNFLIFPHQLYHNNLYLKDVDMIYIVEEPRYFTDFKFHKLKLVYHRASMKRYVQYLKKTGIIIHYVEYHEASEMYKKLKKSKNIISVVDPGDHKLEKKLQKLFGKKLVMHENINFLIKRSELDTIKDNIYRNKKYSHEEFYKYQRKKLDIMVKNGKPEGGKWSYDKMNRLSIPKNHKLPSIKSVPKNKYIKEAILYVNKHFPSNYGDTTFFYPIDRKGAMKSLKTFLKERLKNFGPYEDAVVSNEPFVYHSVLSPMMNIGLITDTDVVTISYDYYKDHDIPIESFEGFIRQVIGWRNYVYTLYMLEGEKMRTGNMMKHTNTLNEKFWTASTGILPVDNIIEKIIKYSYCHHIERLMYLGNFMLLCMVHPDEVYRIFMEWTVDSYDWVMVPNVYGMSQFASDIMMTRPYFSSSNYIIKMSTYKKDGSWDRIWDCLYYNFIDRNYDMIRHNYATAQQAIHWDNKSAEEKKEMKKVAKDFIKELL